MKLCALDDLVPGRGVAALVGDRQIALFRVPAADEVVLRAVDHRDPATSANVLARGLLGTDESGRWYVASPLQKHRFSLDTGRCLDDPSLTVAVHRVGTRNRRGGDGLDVVLLALDVPSRLLAH